MEEDCISVFTKNFFLMGFPVQIFLSNREFGYLGNKIWTNIQTFVRLNLTSSPSLFFCFWCLSSTQITNGEKKREWGRKKERKNFTFLYFGQHIPWEHKWGGSKLKKNLWNLCDFGTCSNVLWMHSKERLKGMHFFWGGQFNLFNSLNSTMFFLRSVWIKSHIETSTDITSCCCSCTCQGEAATHMIQAIWCMEEKMLL